MTLPINQIYKQEKTFQAYPHIKSIFDEITEFANENNFVDSMGRVKGRIYDNALLYHSKDVDFNDKIVCELGARDGIYSSWLTKFVKKIYVSDYFEEWGKNTTHDLGDFYKWNDIWKNAAYDSSKMICETQDITNLTYDDNTFDIVICTSVIEHLYNQCNWEGDIIGIKEIARITKPGGYILLSTDMSDNSKWHSGTLYYSQSKLFERIIEPSGCIINGTYDFSLDSDDNDVLNEIDGLGIASPVVFSLQKPNINNIDDIDNISNI